VVGDYYVIKTFLKGTSNEGLKRSNKPKVLMACD